MCVKKKSVGIHRHFKLINGLARTGNWETDQLLLSYNWFDVVWDDFDATKLLFHMVFPSHCMFMFLLIGGAGIGNINRSQINQCTIMESQSLIGI